MLSVFRVRNFRSIKDYAELNLIRSARNSVPEFDVPDLAPVAAIFGPNASGKSNMLKAMTTMFTMIRSSSTDGEARLPYTPFALGDQSGQPTSFEVVVLLDGIRYDYGFAYTEGQIVSEHLRSWPKGRQRTLFERGSEVEDGWYFGDSLTGPNTAAARATRPESLFLSTARLLQHEILSSIYQKLVGLTRTVTADNLDAVLQTTLDSLVKDSRRQKRVADLVRWADLGIVSLKIEEDGLDEQQLESATRFLQYVQPTASLEEIQAQLSVGALLPKLEHAGENGQVSFPFSWESVGTRNFLALLGPIIDRLESGGVLIVDEIDTSLHPRLVTELVRLFQSPHINRKQAQLVLTTHDVTVMMNTGFYDVLERDQLWLIQKGPGGASRFYSLQDYKPRRDEVFSRNYLVGSYDAVPNIQPLHFWDD